MTEPAPGAGSDPAGAMQTRAERRGGKWVVTGRKWFITGAREAKHFIVVARTSDDARRGLSAFLFHADQPGWRIVRTVPIMGPEEHGGHCEIEFEGLEVPDEDVLMEIGDGLKATQIRLGTARLTHCMRWLGLSKRALEIASEYVQERESFGLTLAEHEGVQWMMGEAAMDIHIGRLLTMHAAWKLDQGDFARKEVSMAKVAVADVLHKAVDTAIQLLGAKGYSKDTPLEWMYRYARQARLVDGASEVHKMVLSRFYFREGGGLLELGLTGPGAHTEGRHCILRRQRADTCAGDSTPLFRHGSIPPTAEWRGAGAGRASAIDTRARMQARAEPAREVPCRSGFAWIRGRRGRGSDKVACPPSPGLRLPRWADGRSTMPPVSGSGGKHHVRRHPDAPRRHPTAASHVRPR